MGVRKSLGASGGNVVAMLNQDFLELISVAIISNADWVVRDEPLATGLRL